MVLAGTCWDDAVCCSTVGMCWGGWHGMVWFSTGRDEPACDGICIAATFRTSQPLSLRGSLTWHLPYTAVATFLIRQPPPSLYGSRHLPHTAAATFLIRQPPPSSYGSRHLPYTAAATFLIWQPPPSLYGRRHLPYTAAATFLIRPLPPSSYGSRHLPYTAAATFLIRPPPPSSYGSRHLPYMAATLLEAPSWWRPSPRDLEAADTFVSKHRTLAVQV